MNDEEFLNMMETNTSPSNEELNRLADLGGFSYGSSSSTHRPAYALETIRLERQWYVNYARMFITTCVLARLTS